jgi:AcrR family transcriptional regulator
MPKSPRKATEERRLHLLSIAGSFFARYGLSKTTLDDIAREAHMGKSSIYYYFTDKEELFKAVLEKEMDVFKMRLEAAIAAAESPQEKLKQFIIFRMQCLRELLNVYNALKDDYLRHYAFIQKLRSSYDRQEFEAIREILADGIKRKVFRIQDLDLTSQAVLIAMKGYEYEWAVRGSGREIERNLDKLLEILFRGIVRR